MIKRAHLYSFAAPIPNDLSKTDDSNNTGNKTDNLLENSDSEALKNNPSNVVNDRKVCADDTEIIVPAAKKGKALKCKCCPGKLILNESDLNKHLASKTHKKRIVKYRRSEVKVEKAKQKFAKRIEQIDANYDDV